MGLPKGFKKNVKLKNSLVGVERRQELLDDIDYKGTFLPKGVGYEDMDESLIDFVKNDLSITIDGDRVPVIFLTIQRWSEFSKTWQHSDKYKDIKIPFITIVRKPDIQIGTNQAGNWNVSQASNIYTYMKVPTFEGGRKGIDVYKIPQPTSTDINYEVRLFCNKMRDVNTFNSLIQKSFNSRQHYIFPKEHPMPIHLEEIGDESKIDDFENRRFYIQVFNLKLLGYVLSEDDFEVIPTVNRFKIVEEVMVKTIVPTITYSKEKELQTVCMRFEIDRRVRSTFKFKTQLDTTITSLSTINLSSLIFKVEGVVKTIPFSVGSADRIIVEFIKENSGDASFELNGIII